MVWPSTTSGDRWFRYETLLLPLSEDGRTVNMLISAISFHDLKIPIAARCRAPCGLARPCRLSRFVNTRTL